MQNLAARAIEQETEPPGTAASSAGYIAEMSAELAAMARRHRLDALAYILDMARLEAENTLRDPGHSC